MFENNDGGCEVTHVSQWKSRVGGYGQLRGMRDIFDKKMIENFYNVRLDKGTKNFAMRVK
jgi:hypothetical protein